jgi:hypothetical protein
MRTGIGTETFYLKAKETATAEELETLTVTATIIVNRSTTHRLLKQNKG